MELGWGGPGIGATGAGEAGGVAPTGELPGMELGWKAPGIDATGAGEAGEGVPEVEAGAAGVGTNVIVLGTLVMMPGFCETWGAQIPAR